MLCCNARTGLLALPQELLHRIAIDLHPHDVLTLSALCRASSSLVRNHLNHIAFARRNLANLLQSRHHASSLLRTADSLHDDDDDDLLGVLETLQWPRLPVCYWAALISFRGFTASTLNLLRAAPFDGDGGDFPKGLPPSSSALVTEKPGRTPVMRPTSPPISAWLSTGPPVEPDKQKVSAAILQSARWSCKAASTTGQGRRPSPPPHIPASGMRDEVSGRPITSLAEAAALLAGPQPGPGIQADDHYVLRWMARMDDARALAELLVLHASRTRVTRAVGGGDELAAGEEGEDGFFFPVTAELEQGLKRALISASAAGSTAVVEFLQTWWLSTSPHHLTQPSPSTPSPPSSPITTPNPPPPSFSSSYGRHGSSALIVASHMGKDQVVNLFLQSPAVDPGFSNSKSLRWASDAGWSSIVSTLLQTNRTDPTSCNWEALTVACEKGHVEIVRMILEWADRAGHSMVSFVDPPNDSESPLMLSAMNGYIDITKLLIASITPHIRSKTLQTAIEMASCGGHATTVSLLITTLKTHTPHLHPSPTCLSTSLELSVQAGHLDVIKVLLETCRDVVDPSFKNGMLMKEAASRGFVEIVRYLLGVGVDPGLGANGALKWAAFHGHKEVVRVLLDVPSLVPSFPNNEPLRFASLMKRFEVVELLQGDPRMAEAVM
ncbi:hypothetical protein HDU67_008810 [Dinochytrium kinnereticum]|nr:hypothetical protein HDU67_008810 [Dinochytrium kinnereticum]